MVKPDLHAMMDQLSVTANKIADDRAILLRALRKICEPITVSGNADTVSACQDLHELIIEIAQEAIEQVQP